MPTALMNTLVLKDAVQVGGNEVLTRGKRWEVTEKIYIYFI